MRKWENSISF